MNQRTSHKIAKMLSFMMIIFSILLGGCAGDSLWAKLNSPADGGGSGNGNVLAGPTDKPVNFDAKYKISIASGASGGGYYMVGTALSQVLQEHDKNLICSSESTGGTSENIALIAREESTIGMGMADDIVSAYKGERDYKGRAADNIRAITSGQTNTFQIIVLASSKIYKLSDLKGKTVSLGPSGAPYFGPDLLESACKLKKDQDYKGQYLAHDQAADALSDGNVDAVIATLAFPASAYSNLAFTKDLRFISLTEGEMKNAIEAHPTWVRSTIPKGTYNLQDKDVTSLAIPVWLFTYASMDEDAIYRITKEIFENVGELGKIYRDAGRFNAKTALNGVTTVIPIFLCSMCVAVVIRNISEYTHLFNVHEKECDMIGSISLNIFLALAMMSLKLWQLVDLALPMTVILLLQTAMTVIYISLVTFPLMGKDYEAAAICAAQVGFGLGATPNAMANIAAVSEKYGPAPKAFFVIPIVGGLFTSLENAALITFFINLFK